jgi:hypothetical protein
VSLFGALVRTAVNVAALPVAVVADAVTLGGVANDRPEGSYTLEAIERLKREAEDAEE